MNKLVLWGIIITAGMLGFTWLSVAGSKGGMNDDIINQLAVVGAVALVLVSVFVVIKYVRQMQTDTAGGELAEENWDGIGEYKNELPFGWAVIFLGSVIWAIWYFLAGYPVNAYSQIGEYNEEVAEKNAKFEKKYANLSHEDLVDMGESVFLAECKVCHGLKADGMNGVAEDLTKRTFTKSYVKTIIENGSNQLGYAAPMPGGMAFGDDVAVVAAYVAGGLRGEQPAAFAACTACHGANGEGMDFVAPSLKTYNADLVNTLLTNGSKKGEIGMMPAFKDRLNAKQKEAVAAYIAKGAK